MAIERLNAHRIKVLTEIESMFSQNAFLRIFWVTFQKPLRLLRALRGSAVIFSLKPGLKLQCELYLLRIAIFRHYALMSLFIPKYFPRHSIHN